MSTADMQFWYMLTHSSGGFIDTKFSQTPICYFIQKCFKKVLQKCIWFICSLPGKYQALFINRDILDRRLRSYSATVPSPVCKSHCLPLSEKPRTERLQLEPAVLTWKGAGMQQHKCQRCWGIPPYKLTSERSFLLASAVDFVSK